MSEENKVSVRPVTIEDAEMLHVWRNDQLTRESSRNMDTVPWENHLAWLEKSLTNPDRKLFIAESDGMPIGTIRADAHDDAWELSWTVAPEARGKGFGKAMVQTFVKQILPDSKLLAEVKKGNTASEKIAESLGLSPKSERPSEDSNDPRPLVEWGN